MTILIKNESLGDLKPRLSEVINRQILELINAMLPVLMMSLSHLDPMVRGQYLET